MNPRASLVDLVRPRPGAPGTAMGRGRGTARGISRRRFLGGGAGLAIAGVIGPSLPAGASTKVPQPISALPSEVGHYLGPNPAQRAALDALGREFLRLPGSVPDPSLPAGTDTLPGIEHVVVVMLENHSFDNVLGMLGRGDGWPLGRDGLPSSTNPYGDGRLQHAFHMPTTCQLPQQPSQEWRASWLSYNGGAMDGFVTAPISPSIAGDIGGVAMGYWTGEDLPFTYSLASVFPVADRWFGSLLGQTDPNRRFLVAGTSSGMTDDISASTSQSVGTVVQDALLATPALTIFDVLSAFGISWTDYTESFPLGETAQLDPVGDAVVGTLEMKPVADFYSDAAAGRLPAFCIVEPDYDTQSQENPQNMVVGEAFLAGVVTAIGAAPDWESTLLIFTYDEHGGYFDHVPPPVALAPDATSPIVQPGEGTYEGFERFGVRVPGVLVSAYAKRDYVSHVVFDHTSILALLQRKWNLPALTLRDANANDLTDMLDLGAMADRSPTFPSLPTLAGAGDTPAALACSVKGPGVIPPAGSISAA
jgi:phospholipase C